MKVELAARWGVYHPVAHRLRDWNSLSRCRSTLQRARPPGERCTRPLDISPGWSYHFAKMPVPCGRKALSINQLHSRRRAVALSPLAGTPHGHGGVKPQQQDALPADREIR